MTVLVVEDDFASRQYLLLLLRKLEYLSIAAETGEEALELMKNNSADIFLLDIALGPGINGIELGTVLKREERFAGVPMVAVTAFTKDKLDNLDEAGFSDYMAKPYTIVQLQQLLEKHLN
ncbi:MAG: response regulator [Candidatus Marinimicrobia bacterium]|nr:response regulator [Candidatus Neomarinimicrobiota bacterium]